MCTRNRAVWYIIPTLPCVKPTLHKPEMQFCSITQLELLKPNILSHHIPNLIQNWIHKQKSYFLENFSKVTKVKKLLKNLKKPFKNIKINKLVPRADRFMKIYINHPQTTCFHPVKWRLEIPSRLGGVWRQRISSHLKQTYDGQTGGTTNRPAD